MTNRTHEERRKQGRDVLSILGREGTTPEQFERAFEDHHGAFGSLALDYMGGDIWTRSQLSLRDRNLVCVALLATLSLNQFLPAYLGAGLRRGLSRAEMEEALIQVGGYAGMPFGNAAMQVATEFFDSLPNADPRQLAAKKSDHQRRADAVDVLRTLTDGRAASDPEAARAAMVENLGGVGELAYDFAFGELWSRDELSRRDRSLVVVAILAALSKEQELVFHVPAALTHGVTRDEIEEVMVTLAGYGGFPRGVEGMRAARAAFARIDDRESS